MSCWTVNPYFNYTISKKNHFHQSKITIKEISKHKKIRKTSKINLRKILLLLWNNLFLLILMNERTYMIVRVLTVAYFQGGDLM